MGLIGTELSAPSQPLADLASHWGCGSHHNYPENLQCLGLPRPWNIPVLELEDVCIIIITQLLKLPCPRCLGEYLLKWTFVCMKIFYNFIPPQCQALETALKGHRPCSQEASLGTSRVWSSGKHFTLLVLSLVQGTRFHMLQLKPSTAK